MLPPFIIEQIKKREHEERRQRQQQPLVLDLPVAPDRPPSPQRDEDSSERGVVIIDLS